MMGRTRVFHCDIPPGGAKPLPEGATELREAHLAGLARSALAWEWGLGVAGIRDGVLWMRPFLIPWRRFETPVGHVRRVVLYRALGLRVDPSKLGRELLLGIVASAALFGVIAALGGLVAAMAWRAALLGVAPRAAAGGACICLLFNGLSLPGYVWEFRKGISLLAFQIGTDGGPDRVMALSVKRRNEASALACLAPLFEIEQLPPSGPE